MLCNKEIEFKRSNGLNTLLEMFQSNGISDVIDSKRKSVI